MPFRKKAVHLGAANPQTTQVNSLIDARLQWKEWRNVWHNAGIRSGLYMPAAMIKKVFRKTI